MTNFFKRARTGDLKFLHSTVATTDCWQREGSFLLLPEQFFPFDVRLNPRLQLQLYPPKKLLHFIWQPCTKPLLGSHSLISVNIDIKPTAVYHSEIIIVQSFQFVLMLMCGI